MADITGMLQAAAGASAGGGDSNAWDITYATVSAPESLIGDFDQLLLAAEAPTGTGISTGGVFFKPDGTKAFVGSDTSSSMRQFSLSNPWDFESRTLIGTTVTITGGTGGPTGAFYFKPDGTVLFINRTNDEYVDQYSLSTAWDITSATYVQRFYVGTQTLTKNAAFTMSTDGTKMYVGSDINADGHSIYQYDLGTAWDISTASYVQKYQHPENIDTESGGVGFSEDGTTMYVMGYNLGRFIKYTLSTAWDISTASYVSYKTFVRGYQFYVQPNEQNFYFPDFLNDLVYRGVHADSFLVSSQEATPTGVYVSPDGTKMYVTGKTGDDINEYDLSTPYLVSSASYVQNAALGFADPEDIFFKPDGTKLYAIGYNTDRIYEYSLSTAWDVSSLSSVTNILVSGIDAQPSSVFFNTDGTKMYFTGRNGDKVNEYNLGTAWSLATATYSQQVSVPAQPEGMYIDNDGTRMYVVCTAANTISQYELSTPFDVSTASLVVTLSISSFGRLTATEPISISWKSDGTKFFILDETNEYVVAYEIPE